MLKFVCAIAVTFAAASMVYAQEQLVGNWSGSFTYTTGATTRNVDIGVQLKIDKVEGNLVTGTVKTLGGTCAGDYQMRGKLDDNGLGMISTNTAGSAGDCKFGFRAKIDGNKMVGTAGTNPLQLTKQ